MTLVAGFVCDDGIVVCADRLFTGVNKTYGDKAWIFPANGVTVVLAGADEKLLIYRVRDDLQNRLAISKPNTLAEAVTIAREVLHEVHVNEVLPNLPGDEYFSVAALVAVRAPDGLGLYESEMGVLASVGDRACLSNPSGQALGQYLSEWLFDSSMPVAWGRVVAAHTLRLTGKYSPDIGGQSRIITIPTHGDVSECSDAEVAELEDYLTKVDTSLREILLRGFDRDVPSKEIQPHVDALIEALGIARFKPVVYQTESGGINMYGKVSGDKHK